jgi:putative transcriptional regulator
MSRIGDDIVEGMAQALAYMQGVSVPGIRVHEIEIEDIDARAVRKSLNLTQLQMAAILGTSVSGYRKWEQGLRRPSGAARTLLRVMEREPEAVMRALAEGCAEQGRCASSS